MKGVIEIGEKKLVVETYSDKMKSGKILLLKNYSYSKLRILRKKN